MKVYAKILAKLILINLTALLLAPQNIFPQEWVRLEPTFEPPGIYHFFAGEFFNENDGWAVDINNYKILNTTDGGVLWSAKYDFTGYNLADIFKLSEKVGWITYAKSDTSIHLKTNDGGNTWQESILPFYSWKVFFVDESFGFTFGDTNYYRTVDGGGNWDKIEIELTDTSLFGVNMFFLDREKGWILANNGDNNFTGDPRSYLLKTNDGGMNWIVERYPKEMPKVGYTNIAFVDSLNGVLTHLDGAAYYTNDGGEKWVESSGINEMILDLVFTDKKTAWIAGTLGNINLTKDIGKTWENVETNTTNTIYAISFINNEIGYAFGDTNTLLKYEGVVGIKDASNYKLIKEELLLQNYPNPFNPTTTISYYLPESGIANIKVFDILGREVKELVSGYKQNGLHKVVFDGFNLSSGVYIYTLKADQYSYSKKLVLVK